MEQELTIPKNIINYLAQNFTLGPCKASECLEIISDNYIVDDQDNTIFKLFDESISFIDSIDPINRLIKDHLREKFKYLLHNCRTKIEDIHIEDWKNDMLQLCNLSKDKILVDTNYEDKEIKQLRKRNFNIEFHNVDSFLKPDSSDRLKHSQFKLKLEADVWYNLNGILFPFLRNAQKIVIIEPYITTEQNLTNFKKLLSIIPKSIICRIKKLRIKHNFNVAEETDFSKFVIYAIKEGWDIRIEHFEIPKNKKSKHLERYIITDKYEIYLPGGFNCLNEDGYANVSGPDDIKIIRVEKISN